MFLVDIESVCTSPVLGKFLSVFQKMLRIIQIIGPIISIVSLTITFILLTVNPDDKKVFTRLKNSAIALVVTFFIPAVVNATFLVMGGSFELSKCWNNVSSVNRFSSSTSEYIEVEPGRYKSSLITDPTRFQGGVPRASDSSNSSSSSSSTSVSDNMGVGNSPASKVLFLGDSRTVQMYANKTGNWTTCNYSSGGVHEVGNDIYVAEGAQGIDWMKSTGIPVATRFFQRGTAIVILMGVNNVCWDGCTDNSADKAAQMYLDYINSNASTWKKNGSSLYFVSVNPCDGAKYEKMNPTIVRFNEQMKSGLDSSVGYIDTHSYLINNGYQTTDGLHYDKETYDKIYDYIKSKV